MSMRTYMCMHVIYGHAHMHSLPVLSLLSLPVALLISGTLIGMPLQRFALVRRHRPSARGPHRRADQVGQGVYGVYGLSMIWFCRVVSLRGVVPSGSGVMRLFLAFPAAQLSAQDPLKLEPTSKSLQTLPRCDCSTSPPCF